MAPWQVPKGVNQATSDAHAAAEDVEAASVQGSGAPATESRQTAVVEHFSCEKGSEVARLCREAMARGMLQDPCTRYFARQTERHTLGMWRAMIRLNYRAARRYSEPPLFFCTPCRSAALMAFLYPQQQVSFLQYMRYGGLSPLVRHMPARRWLAAVKHQSAIDQRKESFLKQHGSILFVWLIAADPAKQNQGLGSQLMRCLNQVADERGLHCYLESTTERSHSFYVRHGYQQIDTLRPEKNNPDAPIYYVMVRPPQQKQAQ